MSQQNIIPHPTNLANQKQPPKHLRQRRQSDSKASSSSNSTNTQSNFDSRSIDVDTQATTPEPLRIPRFPLRDLFHGPTIYPTHKFVEFHLSPLPHFRPTIRQGHLHLPLTPFRHIVHSHSLEHEHFCHDSRCTAHATY